MLTNDILALPTQSYLVKICISPAITGKTLMSMPPSFNIWLMSGLGSVHNVAIIPNIPIMTGNTSDGKRGTSKKIHAPDKMPHMSAIYKPIFNKIPPYDYYVLIDNIMIDQCLTNFC